MYVYQIIKHQLYLPSCLTIYLFIHTIKILMSLPPPLSLSGITMCNGQQHVYELQENLIYEAMNRVLLSIQS